MSTIDERIVSIKFNNTQFEAGVRTTMSSLDGLKRSLNFSASIDAIGDLNAAGKKVNGIKFDNKGFDASVKGTVDAANDLKKNLKFDGVTKSLGDLDAAGKKINFKLDPTSFQMGAKGIVDAANNIRTNLNFESVNRSFGSLKSSVQNISFQNIVSGAQSAMKSLGDLDLAGKAVDFLPISDGAEKAKTSISAMSVAGIAALGALAFKAATVGLDMARSLLLDPAKSGLAEYETNLGSIQTIMSNTQWENKSLGDVNAKLDELNAYSDKTIYNFAEMADSIGKFTSAGVSLDDSTAAIKGISNLAALSGSNSQQAATAMQQLSQEMAAGKVGLEGWNSVVNAGMGGKVFQDALIETARNQGSNVDALIAKNGSFRQSLQDGWVTTKVMNETLSKMTGDLTDEQLRTMGYNDEQIVGIQKMAATAQDAATKIKTFSQLTSTLSETTGSGWSLTWKLILGDFEQAKEMWTNVYKVLGDMVQGSADARNNLLKDWNALGGRAVMIDAVSNAFKALMEIIQPISAAFRHVFPPTTGQQLYDFTVILRNLAIAMRPSQNTVNLIGESFKLFFTIIKIGLDIFKGAFSVIFAFFKAFATGGDSIAGSMKPLTDALAMIRKQIEESQVVVKFFAALTKAASFLGEGLRKIIGIITNFIVPLVQLGIHMFGLITWSTLFAHYFGLVGDAFELVGDIVIALLDRFGELSVAFKDIVRAFVEGGLQAAVEAFYDSLDTLGNVGDAALTRITERLESIKRFAGRLADMWDQVSAAIGRAWDKILPLRTAVADLFRDLGEQLSQVFTDVNYDDTLDMVNTGLLAGLVLLFKGFFKKMLGMGDGMKEGLMGHLDTTVESINGVLESLSGTLAAMQQNLQADTLVKIAIAIGIMAISVIALSMVDSGKLTKGLVAIGVMVVILSKAMEALDKISVGSGFLKLPFIAASMILLAIALGLLTIPVLILSRLGWGELLKGLAGVGVLLLFISKATESMAKNPANLIATGVGLMAVAFAIKILASAVADIAKLSFGDMMKGLVGVGILLTSLSIFSNMTKTSKDAIVSGVGLILLGTALKIMASALGDFAAMDVGSLIQGLVVMSLVLAMLSKFTMKSDSVGILKTAAAMIILGFALKIIASAIADFGAMRWQDLVQGLVTMVIALDAMSKAMARVPPNMLTSAIGFMAVALAMKVLASALKDIGGMSWEEIAKGLTVLAAALILISVALIAMQGTLSGAAAILVVAVALAILVPPLQALGNMSWEQIGMGMAALAAVFIIFGLAGLILAPVVPVILALGVAVGMLGLGLMAIGIGTMAFAAGLMVIATAGAAAAPLIIAVVGSILALIPLAMTELGKGIVAFAGVIGNAMPTFLNAFVALLNTLLTAIDMVAPRIRDTLWNLVVLLVSLIVRAIPLFVDAGMKIIIGIYEGIGNNMGKLIDSAVKVVTEFIDGIARNIGKIIESGANLVVKFVEGLAASVRNNSDRMSTAGLDLATAIIDGMVGGLAKAGGRVLQSIGDVANSALNEAKRILGIHSPSREFFAIGKYTDEGWANGTESYGHLVTDATEAVGLDAISTLKKTMTGIGMAVERDMTMRPTIRPVLDLSSFRKDASQMNGMIKSPTLDVATSYLNASALARITRQRQEEAFKNREATVLGTGETHVKFEQYNSSPKALSEIEIYRQTNNQISQLKGFVAAK